MKAFMLNYVGVSKTGEKMGRADHAPTLMPLRSPGGNV